MVDSNSKSEKVPFWKSFARSQVSASVSTIFDFGTYFLLFSLFGVYYGYATASGNIAGAIVSFSLGRYWAFERKEGNIYHQAIRYAITSLMSAFINTTCIILVTENLGIHPTYSKIIVSLLVGIFFNFTMHRYFVYK